MYHSRRWWAVAAVGISILLITVDTTIVALALPTIARSFHLSNSVASIVSLSYLIPMTLLIIPVGIVINRIRPLTAFLIAVIGFAAGSILCGLADAFWVLLFGRVIQGLFGAVIATQGMAVAATVVIPSERGRALGLVGALAPLGSVIGPGIGGLILSQWGWSMIFFINVPFCLLAVVLAIFSLQGVSMGEKGAGSGLQQMGELLARSEFKWALLSLLCSATISGALYYLLPFDLSIVQHLASNTAGAILLCMPLGMAVMGPIGGWLTDRYGAKLFTLWGLMIVFVGVIALTMAVGHARSTFDLAWRLLLIGIGLGLFSGPNQARLMSVGTRETMGAASAFAGMGINLGFVCGPAMISITWLVLTGTFVQMIGGMLLLNGLCIVNVLVAWRSTQVKTSASAAPALNLSMDD